VKSPVMPHATKHVSGSPSKRRPQRISSGQALPDLRDLLSEPREEIDAESDRNGGVRVNARGPGAIHAIANVLNIQIASQTTRICALYIIAAIFAISAALLIIFAPAGRETAVIIVTVALVVIAAACAGFGIVAITLPGLSAQGGVSLPPPNVQARNARGESLAASPRQRTVQRGPGRDKTTPSGNRATAEKSARKITKLVSSIVASANDDAKTASFAEEKSTS
jgi:hypothetical protein